MDIEKKKNRNQPEEDPISAFSKAFLTKLFLLIGFRDVKIKTVKTENEFNVNIQTQDASRGLLIGKAGKNLHAFETLFLSVLAHKFKDKIKNLNINFDIISYKRKQIRIVNHLIRKTQRELKDKNQSFTIKGLQSLQREIFEKKIREFPNLHYEIDENNNIILSLKDGI